MIRCDYILREAMNLLLDISRRHRIVCFVLWSNRILLDFIHSTPEILTESDPYFYRIKEAAQHFIEIESVSE